MSVITTDIYSDNQVGSLLARVGNTPLLRLGHLVGNPDVALYAKAEWHNPGGSIKDRPALNMILDGRRTGKLTQGKTIIDATSGNTGIAYAMVGSILGYRVELVVPANVGVERKRMIEAFGAKVIYSDPLEGTDGSRELVRTIVARNPHRFFYPDQYNNPANWQAHYETTGPEILRQTADGITHFVCGLGTTGTFVGTARRLKENATVRCIAVQPDSSFHGLEGLKHLPSAWVPGIYDPTLADETEFVSTEESYTMVKRLAREEGLLVGISSAAAVVASLRLIDRLDEGVVVTIFPDNASKYLNEKFWEQA